MHLIPDSCLITLVWFACSSKMALQIHFELVCGSKYVNYQLSEGSLVIILPELFAVKLKLRAGPCRFENRFDPEYTALPVSFSPIWLPWGFFGPGWFWLQITFCLQPCQFVKPFFLLEENSSNPPPPIATCSPRSGTSSKSAWLAKCIVRSLDF